MVRKERNKPNEQNQSRLGNEKASRKSETEVQLHRHEIRKKMGNQLRSKSNKKETKFSATCFGSMKFIYRHELCSVNKLVIEPSSSATPN